MKLLENNNLEAISLALSVEMTDCRLDARVESYSCKMVAQDKRLWKGMMQAEAPGTSPRTLQPLSPPVQDDRCWPFPAAAGRSRHLSRSSGSDQDIDPNAPVLCDSISRKTLFDLSAVLNTSFPDYDFSDAKGDHFSKIGHYDIVVQSVDTQLSAVVGHYNRMQPRLWAVIDEEIQLRECNVYSYNPDYMSDPFSEDGCIWSFNYFFHNRRLKRILFMACRALSVQMLPETPTSMDEGEVLWKIDDE